MISNESVRLNLTLKQDLLDQIEEYRHTHRISSLSKAVVQLIRIALDENSQLYMQEQQERRNALIALQDEVNELSARIADALKKDMAPNAMPRSIGQQITDSLADMENPTEQSQ